MKKPDDKEAQWEDIVCREARKRGYVGTCVDCEFEACLLESGDGVPQEVYESDEAFDMWVQKVFKTFLAEQSVAKTAARLGISIGTARSYLRDYQVEGISLYQAVFEPDPESRALVKRLIIMGFDEGRPIKELAEYWEISYQYACRIIKDSGRQLKRGRPRKPKK